MDRTTFVCRPVWPVVLWLIPSICSSLLVLVSFELRAETPEAPNIVLVMADDLGWGDTGYYGHPYLRTPNLDQMARDGVRFDRFYAGAPVCSPTRGSVLTGRHPYRYGIKFANQGHIKKEEICLAERMRRGGYRTGHFGKWHLGTLTNEVRESNRGGKAPEHYAPPWDNGFDVCYSTEAKTPTWWNKGDYQSYGTHYWTGPGKQVHDSEIIGDDSRVIMDPALRFIKDTVKRQQPFFVVVWFHAPHKPIVAGKKYLEMYREIPDFSPDKKESAAHYYGCVTALDEQLGRLRSALKRLGVSDNTLLAFCSDNGPENKTAGRANAVLQRGSGDISVELSGRKRSLNEGGIRVPGLMVWPNKIPPGTATSVPVVTSDYFPTVLAAAGLAPKKDRPRDGVDLLPIARGTLTDRGSSIGFQSQQQKALVSDRYKALCRDGQWKLFDLENDPGEKVDLALKDPERLSEMKKEWEIWSMSCQESARGKDYRSSSTSQ